MQLSYKLIKNTSALKSSHKVIETNYVSKVESEELEKEKVSVELNCSLSSRQVK